MRLPRSKVWRAFPELDRFDDARCARFVSAVRRGLWPGILRRGLALAVLVALYIAVPLVIAATGLLRIRNPTPLMQVLGVLGIFAVFIVPAVPALMVRDWVLRRQIRGLLRRRGSCGKCRYGLAGLPVSDDLVVVCPECGHSTQVDAAMGELAPDGRGGSAFVPKEGAVDATLVVRRWDFAKSLLRPLVLLVVVGLVFLGGRAGWRWYQATFATFPLAGNVARFAAAAQAARPGLGTVNGPDIWPRLQALQRAFYELQVETINAAWQRGGHSARRPSADFITLVQARAQPAVLAAWGANSGPAVALEVVQTLRGLPLARDFADLAKCRVGQRTMELEFSSSAQAWQPNADAMELLAPVCAWAMVASHDGQVEEFSNAIRAGVAIVSASRRDHGTAGQRTATGAGDLLMTVREGLRQHTTEEWLNGAAGALENWPRYQLAGELRLAQVAEADMLAGLFEVSGHIANMEASLQMVAQRQGGAVAVPVGTLGQNLAALNAWYAGMIAWAEQPLNVRATTVPPARPTVPGALTLTQWRFAIAWARLEEDDLQRDGLLSVIAVERFQFRHGRLPVDMAEAAAEWEGVLPPDPYSGQPFGLRVLPDGHPSGKGYVVYSVGPGGKDDGGRSPAEAMPTDDDEAAAAAGLFAWDIWIQGPGE